jgi:predicted RNase H-like nuclease
VAHSATVKLNFANRILTFYKSQRVKRIIFCEVETGFILYAVLAKTKAGRLPAQLKIKRWLFCCWQRQLTINSTGLKTAAYFRCAQV